MYENMSIYNLLYYKDVRETVYISNIYLLAVVLLEDRLSGRSFPVAKQLHILRVNARI